MNLTRRVLGVLALIAANIAGSSGAEARESAPVVLPATLLGDVSPGDEDEAQFEAVKGTKLSLIIRSPSGGPLLVSVQDAFGPIATWSVGGAKTVKKKLTLETDGSFRIEIVSNGVPASFEIAISWKLPKHAKPRAYKKVKPKGDWATRNVAGISKSSFDATFQPKKNKGYGVWVALVSPSGEGIPIGPYIVSGGLVNVPMNETGTYTLWMGGFATKKSSVTVKVEPTPPFPSGFVWLD